MSLPSGEPPSFLAVGKIRRPHGVRGEVLLEVYTDFPERLSPGRVVYAGERRERLVIRQARSRHDGLLLAFEGFDTPEAVGRLRHQVLYIAAQDAAPLPAGSYYAYQFMGMTVVVEADGRELGQIGEILITGANDVYVVRGAQGEVLLPAIPQVIRQIDLQAKRMTVHLLPGLLEEEGE
jgi:16S rRNA processing protein RimM